MRVLVTGAGQGIGASIALRLAGSSMALALAARRQRAEFGAIIDQVRGKGADVVAATGDLADPSTPGRLVDAAVSKFGGLDSVVINAAIGSRGALESIEIDEWDRVHAVNVRSPWLLAVAALPYLRRSQGSIVVVSSVSGAHPHPGTGPYSSSKAALNMLVRQMALEWAPSGVRVNAVSPGFTVTPRTQSVYEAGSPGHNRQDAVPLGRLADPGSDMAGVVAFLLSEDAHYITGQNVVVDGGLGDSVYLRDPMCAVNLQPLTAR